MSKKSLRNVATSLACAAIPLTAISAPNIAGLPQGQFTMGGYGDVTYTDPEGGNSAFTSKFVPIFLFQLNDKLHVESELKFILDKNGQTVTEMEYADIHYYLTDSTVITAGKFLLPFGFF